MYNNDNTYANYHTLSAKENQTNNIVSQIKPPTIINRKLRTKNRSNSRKLGTELSNVEKGQLHPTVIQFKIEKIKKKFKRALNTMMKHTETMRTNTNGGARK